MKILFSLKIDSIKLWVDIFGAVVALLLKFYTLKIAVIIWLAAIFHAVDY